MTLLPDYPITYVWTVYVTHVRHSTHARMCLQQAIFIHSTPLSDVRRTQREPGSGTIAKQKRGQRDINLKQETQSIQLLMEMWYNAATRDVDGHADHLVSKQFPSPVHPLSSPPCAARQPHPPTPSPSPDPSCIRCWVLRLGGGAVSRCAARIGRVRLVRFVHGLTSLLHQLSRD